MTWKVGEETEKGLGMWALMLSLISFEYFNSILAFGIDVPVCAAGVTMIWLLQEDRLNIFVSSLVFAALLAFCFAVRGPMGPVLLGAGTAGWLAMSGRWKTFFAFGATFLIFFQVLFNIGVVTGMLPTKGLALPFISYGGTNLVTALAAVGLLFNVGRQIDSSQPRLHRSPIPA